MLALTQFSSIGVLIIVLLTMGTIAGERKSGIAELILVKPVNHITYILAKWAAKLSLFIISFSIGMLLNWYYVNLLFGEILFKEILYTILFYSLWILFVVSLAIFFSIIFKNSGPVAGVSIGVLIVTSVVNGIVSHRLNWFPNQLSPHINDMLTNGQISTDRKSTRLNSSHVAISYAVFCLKKTI